MAAAHVRTRLHIPLELPAGEHSGPQAVRPSDQQPVLSAVLSDEHAQLMRDLVQSLNRVAVLLERQLAGRPGRRTSRGPLPARLPYRGRHRSRPALAHRVATASFLPAVAALTAVAVRAAG